MAAAMEAAAATAGAAEPGSGGGGGTDASSQGSASAGGSGGGGCVRLLCSRRELAAELAARRAVDLQARADDLRTRLLRLDGRYRVRATRPLPEEELFIAQVGWGLRVKQGLTGVGDREEKWQVGPGNRGCKGGVGWAGP